MKACLDEGVVLTWTQVLKKKGAEMAAKNEEDTFRSLKRLINKIAWEDEGYSQCIDSGTHSVLVSLLRVKSVADNS
jgi:hypothetical protein